MRSARMAVWSLCMVALACGMSSAESVATWTSKVTVLVENNQGDLLQSYSFVYGGTIHSATPLQDPLTVEFSFVPEPLWGKGLFANTSLTDSLGDTIWLTSGGWNNPNYNAVAQKLSDGRSDRLFGFFTVKSAGRQVGGGEVIVRESSLPSGCGADVAIAKIGLRIDDASITQMQAIVPEPSCLVSLICGILGACGFAVRGKWRGCVGIEPTRDLTQTPHRF